VAVLFAVASAAMLAIEPLLARMGWSAREAALGPAEYSPAGRAKEGRPDR
jgi:hypothetical protein